MERFNQKPAGRNATGRGESLTDGGCIACDARSGEQLGGWVTLVVGRSGKGTRRVFNWRNTGNQWLVDVVMICALERSSDNCTVPFHNFL